MQQPPDRPRRKAVRPLTAKRPQVGTTLPVRAEKRRQVAPKRARTALPGKPRQARVARRDVTALASGVTPAQTTLNKVGADQRTTRTGQKGKRARSAGSAKHICQECRHLLPALTMRHVRVHDGNYYLWSDGIAEEYRRRHWHYPPLCWLCGTCYSAASARQEVEERTGEPQPRPTRSGGSRIRASGAKKWNTRQ
jgi:hypothetical protein